MKRNLIIALVMVMTVIGCQRNPIVADQTEPKTVITVIFETTDVGIDKNTIITGPQSPVYRFTVYNDSKNSVTIKPEVVFFVVTKGVMVSGDWSVLDVTATPVVIDSDIFPPSSHRGGQVVFKMSKIVLNNYEKKTFELRAFVSGSLIGAAIHSYIWDVKVNGKDVVIKGGPTNAFIREGL
ncbi:MAG: hypothetical protein V1707_02190 [bacterium]